MQSVSSRIWTRVAVFISYDDTHYTTGNVMVIVVGNGLRDTSSNPGRDWLHSTNTLGKGMNPIILPPAMGK